MLLSLPRQNSAHSAKFAWFRRYILYSAFSGCGVAEFRPCKAGAQSTGFSRNHSQISAVPEYLRRSDHRGRGALQAEFRLFRRMLTNSAILGGIGSEFRKLKSSARSAGIPSNPRQISADRKYQLYPHPWRQGALSAASPSSRRSPLKSASSGARSRNPGHLKSAGRSKGFFLGEFMDIMAGRIYIPQSRPRREGEFSAKFSAVRRILLNSAFCGGIVMGHQSYKIGARSTGSS